MALFSRSDVEPLAANQVETFVSIYTIAQTFQIAMVTFLIYDAMITFDKEVKYFWKIPRNLKPIDLIFFVTRYGGIFGAASPFAWYTFTATLPLCKFGHWAPNIANWVTMVLIDYILMLRVLALYSQDRKLSILLNALLMLDAASMLGLIIHLSMSQQVAVGGYGPMTFCGTYGIIPWSLGMISWLIPMVYGTSLMFLAIYKAAQYWQMSAGFKGFALIRVLIKDQIMYFVLVIASSLAAILRFRFQLSNSYLPTALGLLANPSSLSFLGSRMLINLKEAGERGQNAGTTCRVTSRTVSEMAFAEPAIQQSETESGKSNEKV